MTETTDIMMTDNDVPLFQKKDFSQFGSLMLMVGMACNMRCRHCAQIPVKEKICISGMDINDKVWDMLRHFVGFAVKNPHPMEGFVRHIYFWAGEPLLYWQLIKKVVTTLTSEYKILDNRNFRFDIQSNGLLLTPDKVDFINKYEIDFGLSYDAPYPFAVRGYVPEEQCELFSRIHSRSVQCVSATAMNCNPLLAYKCLKAKFSGAKQYRVISSLTRSFIMPADIYAYDWEAIRQNIRLLRIASQRGDKFALEWFFKYIKNMARKSFPKDENHLFRCIGNPVEIAVSIDGRFNVCHNSNYFLGTVEDSWNTLLEASRGFLKGKGSPECAGCRHADICERHCLLDIRNEDGGFVTCREYYWKLFDIIKSELREIGKPLSESDLLWYREQDKMMEQEIHRFLERR